MKPNQMRIARSIVSMKLMRVRSFENLLYRFFLVLKPVNEYNIVDKIKEANKELFAEQIDEGANSNDDNENNLELMALNGSRKVSFAANLEVYEPLSGISLKELENKLGKAKTRKMNKIQFMKLKIPHRMKISTQN